MDNAISAKNVDFIQAHDKITKRLSPSTLIVFGTYWDSKTKERFDSLLTKTANGSGWQEIALQGGTLYPVSDPLHYSSLRDFLGY